MTVAPPELAIDLMNGEWYINDPWPAWQWMRENAPLYHDEANDLWAATLYSDVRASSSSARSSATESDPPDTPTSTRLPGGRRACRRMERRTC